jgi:hypothetical protein
MIQKKEREHRETILEQAMGKDFFLSDANWVWGTTRDIIVKMLKIIKRCVDTSQEIKIYYA